MTPPACYVLRKQLRESKVPVPDERERRHDLNEHRTAGA